MTSWSFLVPRLQNGDALAQVQRGSLEVASWCSLSNTGGQGATKADIAEVTERLRRIEELPGAAT